MPAFTRKYLQMFALPDDIIDDLLATHQEDMANSERPVTNYTPKQISNMTTDEINQHWDEIKKELPNIR